MEQRVPRKTPNKNTNKNRKRLKVRENPRYNIKYQEKMARKKDRRVKALLTILTLALIVCYTYFTINKRNELIAKRYEYNNLVNESISTELKRDRLKAKLDNSIDLNRIQRYAIEELGMGYETDNEDVTGADGSTDGSDF